VFSGDEGCVGAWTPTTGCPDKLGEDQQIAERVCRTGPIWQLGTCVCVDMGICIHMCLYALLKPKRIHQINGMILQTCDLSV